MKYSSVASILAKIKSNKNRRANKRYRTSDNLVEMIKYDIRNKANSRKQNASTSCYVPSYNQRIDTVVSDIKHKQKERLDETKLNLSSIGDNYYIYINDNSVLNPFGLDANVLKTINREIRDCYGLESKARKFFDWFQQNIKYGDSKKWAGYSTGQEVFRNKEGVCGEMAFLYVTMARSIGLKSDYVSVRKDDSGKKVKHACAGVEVERGYILVDPAYHTFDIKHKKYRIMADQEIMEIFEHWRGK